MVAMVGTTHKTRSRAHMDNAIAELFYAENLPDELAESPHLHKLHSSSTLHGRRQLHTSHQSGVGLSSFAARGEWWCAQPACTQRARNAGVRVGVRGASSRAAATDRWNAAVRQSDRHYSSTQRSPQSTRA